MKHTLCKTAPARGSVGRFLLLTVLIATLSASTVSADVGVSLKIGTQGLGGDVTVGLFERLNVRAGVSGGSIDDDYEDDDGNNYTAAIDLLMVPILLDWHPFAGNFRVSGGVVINRNEITASAVPGEPVELDGTDYTVDRLDAAISFRSTAPYFGIGYGNAGHDGSRFDMVFDLGVMYHGEPELSASATASNAALQSQLNSSLATEVDELNADIDGYAWYPVLNFGILLRF